VLTGTDWSLSCDDGEVVAALVADGADDCGVQALNVFCTTTGEQPLLSLGSRNHSPAARTSPGLAHWMPHSTIAVHGPTATVPR